MVTNKIDKNPNPSKTAVGDGDDQQNLVCGLYMARKSSYNRRRWLSKLVEKLTKNIQTILVASCLKPGELGGAMTNDGD